MQSRPERAPDRPIRLALIDDYDVVVVGVARMFDRYAHRVEVVELDVNRPVDSPVDVALYDSFAQPEADGPSLESVITNPRAERVVVYTWCFRPELVELALERGTRGYLAKTMPAAELVDALERVVAGQVVVSDPPPSKSLTTGLDWPGRAEGLSEREAELLALITQGRSNAEIEEVVHLSANTIKSYIRSAYRKIGATTRVEAVLWGVDHGFVPDRSRISDWAT